MPKSHPYPRLSDEAQHELRRCIVDCYTQVPPDARTGRRVQVIRDLHRGFSVKGLSKNFRVSVRSIRAWWAAYRRHGLKGLWGKPRPGVHLTGEQIDQLWKLRLQRPKKLPRPKSYSVEALTQTCLQQAGTSGKRHVRRSPWSFPRLARWVKAHWGIKVSSKQLARKMLRPCLPRPESRPGGRTARQTGYLQ